MRVMDIRDPLNGMDSGSARWFSAPNPPKRGDTGLGRAFIWKIIQAGGVGAEVDAPAAPTHRGLYGVSATWPPDPEKPLNPKMNKPQQPTRDLWAETPHEASPAEIPSPKQPAGRAPL